jgi:hypothetical protein
VRVFDGDARTSRSPITTANTIVTGTTFNLTADALVRIE